MSDSSRSAARSGGTSQRLRLLREATPDERLSKVEQHRLESLLDRYPSLPIPIATAMVKRAGDGPVGSILGRLEEALDQLNELPDLAGLSGSEIRVLDVALAQISSRVAELQNSLNRNWSHRQ